MDSVPVPDVGLGYLMLLLMATAAVMAGFFGFEAWALFTGHVPITLYARMLTPRPFLVVAAVAMFFLAIGILLGHFWA